LTEMVVEVKDLKMYFPVTRGVLNRQVAEVKAVDGLSFSVRAGETLGLVGESGCGKTTVGRCILRLYEPTSGQILFKGVDITHLPERRIRQSRCAMGTIFQDPYSSLDPRMTAGSIVGEQIRIHHAYSSRAEYKEKIAELFHSVELDPSMARRVPHEFSGGQRQRISIARAISLRPSLVVCDEPISALDVSIQAQIINLLEEIQDKMGLAFLFISHDLAMVRHISDRVAVMYLGRIVEITTALELYQHPLHPYTKALLSAVPIADPVIEQERSRISVGGEVPSPLNPPAGCHFHPRCLFASGECGKVAPPLREISPDHQVACHLV
jgi:oligopeptide/dipeptide ABC transporter ATP-binding protein